MSKRKVRKIYFN